MSSSLLFPIPSTVNTKRSIANIHTPTAANAIPMNDTSKIVLLNQTFSVPTGTLKLPLHIHASIIITLGAVPTMKVFGQWEQFQSQPTAGDNIDAKYTLDNHTFNVKQNYFNLSPTLDTDWCIPVTANEQIGSNYYDTYLLGTLRAGAGRVGGNQGLVWNVPTWPSITAAVPSDFFMEFPIIMFDGKIIDPSFSGYTDPGFYYDNAWHLV